MHLEANVPIEMSDGVRLVADVYRPAAASGSPTARRLPVLLVQIPYNKGFWKDAVGGIYGGYNEDIVRHGYVLVLVDVRGTGSSPGKWEAFSQREQQDGVEIARWLRGQPWSDGRLGLYGGSYMGINQFFTAARRPRGLKAVFSLTPAEDIYRDVVWHGGALDSGFMPFFLGIITVPGLFPPEQVRQDPQNALRVLVDRLTQRFQGEILASALIEGDLAFDGPFYQSRSPGNYVRRINVPTFIIGGWNDIFVRGQPRLYRSLRMRPGRKQLLFGPWAHAEAGLDEGLPAPGVPILEDLAILWFDRWIKGRRNGIEDYGPITSYQLGPGDYKTYSRFPPPGTRPERLYLRQRRSGSAAHALFDGSLSGRPPVATGRNSIEPTFVTGLCTGSAPQWTGGVVERGTPCTTDERTVERSSLTYTTGRLRQPLHLAGPIGLTLRGSTQARDTMWIATLSDVAPGGASSRLTAGWLLQSRRAVDLRRSERTPLGDLIAPFHPFTRESVLPVTPGDVNVNNVEIFNTDAVIRRGHRLRLTLQGGDFPHLLSPAPVLADRLGGPSTVHYGPRRPSYVTVSVVRPLGPCLARRSPVGRRNIGRVRLGLTRARLLALRVRAPRSTTHSLRWCVKGSRGRVTAVFSRGRAVLATTTARRHGNRGVRPGARVPALRRAYPRRRRLGRGLFRAGPRSTLVIRVRRGRVRLVGVASRHLVRSPRALRRALRRAGY